MLCLYYNMFWELRKPHFDGTVQSKIVFPESEVFCRRLVVPVILLCFFIIQIVIKEVVISDGNVFPNVLQGHERGSGGGIVAVFEHNLHGCDIPYFGDRTVLDGCIGVTLDIHLDIERRDEDHDGLVGSVRS